MLVIYGSSRPNGNTEQLAKIALEGIKTEDVYLRDKNITPITDLRHAENGFSKINDDYYKIAEAMLSHDRILFVNPVYWYGMSGRMKLFIDRWSESLADPVLAFKNKMNGKKMYVLAVGGDNPKIKALPLVMQFQHTFEFVGASFEGYVIGEANRPGDILSDEDGVEKAQTLNRLLQK
ncbi:MAG TPA: flavodoxin family protein [Bacillales bacterium]|nr:flavodoxin family protein [Bacillales bacterium]